MCSRAEEFKQKNVSNKAPGEGLMMSFKKNNNFVKILSTRNEALNEDESTRIMLKKVEVIEYSVPANGKKSYLQSRLPEEMTEQRGQIKRRKK